MKVSDLAKITAHGSFVCIFVPYETRVCKCEDAVICEADACSDCEDRITRAEREEIYSGLCENIPIKLAERRVKEISAEDWNPEPTRGKKNRELYPYLFVEVTR